jgi:alpha-beta hydrolase superfamily lysophospholipase
MKDQAIPFFIIGMMLVLYGTTEIHGEAGPSTKPTTVPTAAAASPVIRGVVSAKYHRLLKTTRDPVMQEQLKRFEVSAGDFSYKKRMQRDEKTYSVWTVNFPSPFCSADACNNVVWGEYFQTKNKKLHPAVIVLHPLDSQPEFMRFVCSKLAEEGMDSIWIRMAYFGERASKGVLSAMLLVQKPEYLISAVSQTVMDIRRTSEFLSAQPNVDAGKIYLCGGSLGALIGSLAMGVDGNYSKVVLILGGGDLGTIFSKNEGFMRALETFGENKNITKEDIQRDFKPIEPLTYVSRTDDHTEVLMINAKNDNVIAPEASKELANHLKHCQQIWYDWGHEIRDRDEVTQEVLTFFKK